MSELRLVSVGPGLVEDWREVHNAVVPSSPLSSAEVQERLGRFRLHLAYAGTELVGCTTVRPSFGEDGETTVIVRVLPEHRRRGHGGAMLRLLLDDVGPAPLETIVWEANTDGLRFARAHGFVEETERYLAPGDSAPFLTLRRRGRADPSRAVPVTRRPR